MIGNMQKATVTVFCMQSSISVNWHNVNTENASDCPETCFHFIESVFHCVQLNVECFKLLLADCLLL